jgi:hypothetical protein
MNNVDIIIFDISLCSIFYDFKEAAIAKHTYCHSVIEL